MPTLSIADAQALVAQTLMRCRTSETNARIVAHELVAAEADGLKGHGLSRAPTYAAQAKVGKVDGMATPHVETRRAGALLVDAAHGFAYPAIAAAAAALPDMARQCGVAAAAIRRSHHCGVAGHPVERLAAAGFVALMFANTPAAIAPWGGSRGLFGTNPIAFACPLPDAPPIVVDLSLSKVARGNILMAQQKGEPIPTGWALDSAGRETTDARAALAGTMVPFGDAKGTVLALMVELLAAGLTGANFASEASSFLDAQGPPPGTGQLLIVLDASAWGADAITRFGALAQMIGQEANARLPGVRRLENRAKAARDGLAVSEALIAECAKL
ncbi:MAG: Ldh family oxidoreductase [Proteobacteria bacterium]|nr:Ldh family oxidoreductase [Pseudomonadota bacterium]